MVSKRTVPIKLYIKEFATVAFRSTLLSHIAAIRHFLPYDFSRILVSRYCKPLFRPFMAFDVVLAVIIIPEASYKTQSFGHEIQFLFQRYVRLNIICPVFIKTGLCGSYPRISFVARTNRRQTAIRIHHRSLNGIVTKQLAPHISISQSRTVAFG